jgi:hypothetical protein
MEVLSNEPGPILRIRSDRIKLSFHLLLLLISRQKIRGDVLPLRHTPWR